MAEQPEKKLKLSEEEIQPIAEGYGFCFASDRVMVHGDKVSFAYREEPEDELDSGWRFLSGEETQEYLDNDDNVGVYDVNVVANYCEDIVVLLEEDVGTAFERDDEANEWVLIELVDEDDEEYEDDDEVDEDGDEEADDEQV